MIYITPPLFRGGGEGVYINNMAYNIMVSVYYYEWYYVSSNLTMPVMINLPPPCISRGGGEYNLIYYINNDIYL